MAPFTPLQVCTVASVHPPRAALAKNMGPDGRICLRLGRRLLPWKQVAGPVAFVPGRIECTGSWHSWTECSGPHRRDGLHVHADTHLDDDRSRARGYWTPTAFPGFRQISPASVKSPLFPSNHRFDAERTRVHRATASWLVSARRRCGSRQPWPSRCRSTRPGVRDLVPRQQPLRPRSATDAWCLTS